MKCYGSYVLRNDLTLSFPNLYGDPVKALIKRLRNFEQKCTYMLRIYLNIFYGYECLKAILKKFFYFKIWKLFLITIPKKKKRKKNEKKKETIYRNENQTKEREEKEEEEKEVRNG